MIKVRYRELISRLESIEIAGLRGSLIFIVFSSIAIAFLLVLFSMHLYNQSGAAQLDLSRPVYEDVRSQAWRSARCDGFDAGQGLTQESLDGFEVMFKDKRDQIRGYSDAFSPADISDDTLGVSVK